MKDSSAEEIISRKIRAEEAESGLPERSDLLWSQLDKRLEQKKAVPVVRYYALRAAAAILVLFMLGFYLYPTRKTNPVQQTTAMRSVETNSKIVPEVPPPVPQQPLDSITVNVLQTTTAGHRNKKSVHYKQEEKTEKPEKQEEEKPARQYAGLYAMPQPACADVSAEQYQLCYQTL